MASAKISFEAEGKQYSLYFGMASVRIFQERSAKEYLLLVQSGIEDPTQEDLDQTKVFANVIYSGLCNMADINDEQRPLFAEAYELADSISNNIELCKRINDVWAESQPVKDMIDRLADSTQPKEEKKSTPRKTGKKLKPTHSVS